jgi:HAD superfamily hydrolase (TIGR01509 family)
MIKLVIFDLDGVLVDTEQIHYTNLISSIEELTNLTFEEITSVVRTDGTSTKTKLNDLQKRFSISSEVIDLIDVIKQEKTTKTLKELSYSETLNAMLHDLKSKYKLSLISNSRRENIQIIINNLGISQYFDYVVFPNDILKPKPSGDMHSYVLNKLNLSPRQSVVFEDSPVGIESALNANCNVVEVSSVESVTLENVNHAIEKIIEGCNMSYDKISRYKI